MSFCTAVSCIDGRIQVPVIRFLQERYGFDHVDMVTEAGPVGAIASTPDSDIVESIMRRVSISVGAHESGLLAVVAHADCAGNPVDAHEQQRQVAESARCLSTRVSALPVVGLWVDETLSVTVVCSLEPEAVPVSD